MGARAGVATATSLEAGGTAMSGARPDFLYASAELDAMAGAVNYHRAILERFLPHLPASGGDVVEIGAGIGTVAAHLLETTELGGQPLARLTLVEPAGNNIPHLLQRFGEGTAAGAPGGTRVVIRPGYFADVVAELTARGGVDAVVMVNVLEHVPDDAGLLADIHRSLKPGGRLCLFVPALPWLFGTLDEAFEHHRRYTVRGIHALLSRAGFGPIELRYMNAAGVLPWFVTGRLLRRRTLAPAAVALYDRFVTPWVRRLERHWTPPLGQSVLAVAER